MAKKELADMTAAEIQYEMETAMIRLENEVGECLTALDADDLLEAGTHVLGDKHPAVKNLRKWVHALDRSIDAKVMSHCVKATYTSVHDDSIVCTSACTYNTKTQTCFDIETAENADDADDANGLTDEYVTVEGKELRESDGVTFDY